MMILKLVVVAVINLMSLITNYKDCELVIENQEYYDEINAYTEDEIVELYNHEKVWFTNEEETEGIGLMIIVYEMPTGDEVYGVGVAVANDGDIKNFAIVVDEDWDTIVWGIY